MFADSEAMYRARIGATHDKILGVDMEAAGVGRAVEMHNLSCSDREGQDLTHLVT